MSHVTKIELVIQDLKALAMAVAELGLEVRHKKTYRWYGSWVNDYHADDAAYHHGIKPEDYGKCEFAIGIPGNSTAYEIGVVQNPNGPGYVLIYDFYGGGGGMRSHVGDNKCSRLKQAYGVAATQLKAQQLGYAVKKQVLSDGTVKMQLTR